MAEEATPIMAFAAILLGIIAAAANGDAWWFFAGAVALVFLIEQPVDA
ncbi:hypothetical protein [Amycolatopsis pithecellobii]|uniref:Uncharacterized protein n=1 Tax=Amycolatopsis pithecellobii TaxID=664692 RepID=A0A6N7Z0W2_9PSEU|nr:hypothetical protein [Amycolatopsis pithecellobii]MTD54993.1 hypothetical protein [Amycolatopsis pithecellobii]